MTKGKPSILHAAGILLLIDLFWIATGGIFARNVIEKIQGSPVNLRFISAGIVYLVLGYLLLEMKSLKQAFIYGICVYAVFDFTNYSLFDNYDIKFALADTLWGGVLFSAAYLVLSKTY